jgi:hypothetical protein
MIVLLLTALLLSSINNANAFRISIIVSSPSRHLSSSSSLSSSSDNNIKSKNNYYNDFDEVKNGNGDNNYLLTSLRQRQRSLNSQLYERWMSGTTTSSRIGFTINESFYNNNTSKFDWVRRLCIGTYPHVVCGSASGAIYIANVEEGKLLASASCAHYPSSCNNDEDDDDDILKGDDNFALLRLLYGDYDGGGVLAVAMTSSSSPVHSGRSVLTANRSADLIASAGREGGVKLHEWVRWSDKLKYIGSVPMCSDDDDDNDDNSVIITSLKFDSVGRLYAGGGDGHLRVINFDNNNSDEEVGMRTTLIPPSHEKPSASSSISSLWQWKRGELTSTKYLSPILSMDIAETLNLIATAHANGDVCVYSLHNGVDERGGSDSYSRDDYNNNALTLLGVWNPFADTNDASHARSVTFVSGGRERGDNDVDDDKNDEYPSWSIVVGGGNGQMWVQELHPSYYANDGTTTTSTTPLFLENTMQQIKPPHNGPVVALASRSGGVLVSAGHDGVLRISQISASRINPERVPPPKALYGLGGYKVWIGNICIDDEGKRLLSDGRDDVVVIHDFSLKDNDD